MDKKTKSFLMVGLITLILYCILYLLIPFPKTAAYWIEFAFSLIAIAGGFAISQYAVKNDGVKSKFYGFPLLKIGTMYMAIQLILSFIIAVSGFFADVPVWIAVVLSAIILGVSAIGTISIDTARNIIEEQERHDEAVTKIMRTFRLDIQYIVDSCSDTELKKSLEKLAEKFRYSDPVSNEALADVEEKLQQEVKALEETVNKDKELAKKKIDKVTILLADRNRRCKEFKK